MTYVETIRIKNGRVQNIRYHNDRCYNTRVAAYETAKSVNLRRLITVPEPYKKGLVKCRVLYDTQVREITYQHYTIKPMTSLQLVTADHATYEYKTVDRAQLTSLYNLRTGADDIIMVRNGLLTDTYYGNIALSDGEQWYTPTTPMLAGTRRQQLIDRGIVQLCDIKPADLAQYRYIAVINAMLPMGEVVLPCSAVRR